MASLIKSQPRHQMPLQQRPVCGPAVPGRGSLALHLLAVPDLDSPIIGTGGKDGVLVGDADAVHCRFVLMQVSHQQAFGVPPWERDRQHSQISNTNSLDFLVCVGIIRKRGCVVLQWW